jgi:uncharacterized protein YjbI with pentapeptide repeats
MKASELINLYQRGKRNFSRENISGQNFDSQGLSTINLSYADIRGASFVNANLTGANFSYARAGSILRISLVTISLFQIFYQLIISALAMSLAIFYCISLSDLLSVRDSLDPDTGGLGFGLLWGYCLITSLFFLLFSYRWIIENMRIVFIGYIITILLINITLFFLIKFSLINGFIFLLFFLFPLIILVTTTALLISKSFPYQLTWRATSFRGANLEGADFSQADLVNSDFRSAQLESTCFYQVKNLNIKLFKKTKLAKPKALKKAIMTAKNTRN